jgi:hypothetical protein
MKETEELELKDVELFAEYLEFQVILLEQRIEQYSEAFGILNILQIIQHPLVQVPQSLSLIVLIFY